MKQWNPGFCISERKVRFRDDINDFLIIASGKVQFPAALKAVLKQCTLNYIEKSNNVSVNLATLITSLRSVSCP